MSRPNDENPKDRLEKTARELRKHRPRPSAALVARVERIAEGETERRPSPIHPRVSRRRLVFALAATLAVAAAGAIVAGELGQSPRTAASGATGSSTVRHNLNGQLLPSMWKGYPTTSPGATDQGSMSGANPYYAPTAGSGTSSSFKKGLATTTSGAEAQRLSLAGSLSDSTAASSPSSLAPITTGNRLAELKAVLMLKVENRDQLSEKTAEAMKIVRSLNGYVVKTEVDAPSRGVATSYLVLKVPAKRSQEALIAISELGKILSQQVSLVDVKATVTSEGNAIQALKREIASLEKTLSGQSLTAQARSQIEIQLANDRARLNSLRVQRTSDILRGRLATITLTLTTGDLPKPAATPSRVHKAIDRAWDGLSSEISWAAMGIIVASPFLVIGIVLLALLRTRRRREDRRLLEK